MTSATVQPYPEAPTLPADEFAAPAEVYASDLPDAGQLLTLMLVLLLVVSVGLVLPALM